jgi:hypothetical protein
VHSFWCVFLSVLRDFQDTLLLVQKTDQTAISSVLFSQKRSSCLTGKRFIPGAKKHTKKGQQAVLAIFTSVPPSSSLLTTGFSLGEQTPKVSSE